MTNVVKHFRFEERGKKRLHKKPTRKHVEACGPWLEAELERVEPSIIVCLGSSAAQSLLGSQSGDIEKALSGPDVRALSQSTESPETQVIALPIMDPAPGRHIPPTGGTPTARQTESIRTVERTFDRSNSYRKLP